MNKLNLIIDFNNILMRGLNTPGMTFYNSNYEDEHDLADIVKKLAIDICYNIRLFKPNRAILVCDSPNAWRKDILPKDESGYKANRIKDDTKNWNNIWKIVKEFKDILKSKGIIISEIDRAEADDLAALWKYQLYTLKNESIVYISSDKDWRQLVDYNNVHNNFCVIFNPCVNNKGRKKLFLTDNCLNYINSSFNNCNTDPINALFFDNTQYNIKESITNALSTDRKIDTEIIDGFDVLVHKIFEGDMSDNVPSYFNYYKTTKRGTNIVGITPSQVKKLTENLNINSITDLVDAELYVKPELEKIIKMDISVDAHERLNRQRILVELNHTLFPETIINNFNNIFQELYEIIMPTNLYNIKWTDVLANTRFLDINKDFKPQENKIFSDLSADGFNKYFTKLF